MSRALAMLAVLLVATGAARGSGATFTASASNPGTTFATKSDWVAPAVTLTLPADGGYVATAKPTLLGTAGTASGDVNSVTVKLYSGASAMGTPVQTRTATPAGGAWTTTATTLADGQYTAQAAQADGAGNTGTSAPHTFRVDTLKPTAAGIAAANAASGGTAGHLDAGDVITFTFSEAIDPASILSSWSGASSTAVKVKFTDNASNDSFAVLDGSGGTTVHLDGGVATKGNFVSGTVVFAATMARVSGGSAVTVTLGAPDAPGNVQALAVAAKKMAWTIAAGPKDLAGNAITTGSLTESDSDVDF